MQDRSPPPIAKPNYHFSPAAAERPAGAGAAGAEEESGGGQARAELPPPPPPLRTNRTRLVPPPVLTGHVSSLLQDLEGRGAPGPPELSPVPLQPDAVTASLGFASPRG
jgi:hypothetical protein